MIAQGFVNAFFQGKFISLFSFMFGLGFAIQLSRAEARGVRFMGFYPRRLLALALFGLIHGIFIWAGDILLTYAFSGALLLFFRKRKQKTLLWWAGSLFSVPIIVQTVFLGIYLLFRPAWMTPKPPDMKKIQAIVDIYAHGSVRQIMAQNWVEFKDALPTALFGIYILALFLLGMWVWRAGVVQRMSEYRPVLKRVCAWCLTIGIPLNLYVAAVFALVPQDHVSYWFFSAGLLYLPATHILAAGYASGLALIFLSGRWRPFLTRFAAVGRMALTNYLMESVICTLFFYHYTTGLYGRVGPALGIPITIVIFAAQVAFSNWWVSRYRFGPMEWLWRGLTYGKFPSMSKDEPMLAAPATADLAVAQVATGGTSAASTEK